MKKTSRTTSFLFLFITSSFVFSQVVSAASPIGKKNKVPFSKSLPEDISNENFPDIIESFDYPDASIIDLIKAIGKLTGLNFIVDPSVSNKKITIVAPSKITVAEAYKAFLSALAINGYTIIKSGAFWKIQETKKALKDNTEIYSDGYFPNTDQLITRIIKLKYIDAKEFSDSIKYLLSQNNQISHHKTSNSVILSDYGSVVERIMKIVYEMDIPGSEENVEIILVRHAASSDLALILNQILSLKDTSSASRLLFNTGNRFVKPKLSTSKKKKESTGNIKISNIIPDERTNSLVVSANKEGLIRVRELVKKLDTYVDPSRTGGIYVYNVLYGTAEEVYNTLMGISPSSGGKGKNSTSSRRGQSFRSNNFSRFNSRTNSSSSPLFKNVTIMADQNTNSLIISAKNKYDFERVKEVLRKIDVPRDQVFVQAIIVEMSVDKGDHWEVNLTKLLSSGLGKWSKFLNINGTPVAGFLNRSFSASPTALQNNKFGPGLVLGLPFKDFLKNAGLSQSDENDVGQFNELVGSEQFKSLSEELQRAAISNFNRSNSPLAAVNQALNYSMFPLIQVLKRAGNINILSTPQITALDNTTASIEVGENAPVGLTSSGSTGVGFQNSVQREDVTLRLEITPRINPDSKTIQMDISQKFDDFSSKQSTASELSSRAVHLIKRNIETKLVLNDGETAVLGGLLVDKEVRHENKVPILGDIPILGWLFKGSTVQKEKKNLLVFITPTIIEGKNQSEAARKLLGKKLEERIHFVKKNMSGKDPHGAVLNTLIPSLSSKNKNLFKNTEDTLMNEGLSDDDFSEKDFNEEQSETQSYKTQKKSKEDFEKEQSEIQSNDLEQVPDEDANDKNANDKNANEEGIDVDEMPLENVDVDDTLLENVDVDFFDDEE